MAINKIPRVGLDRRSAADDYEMVGGDSGGFGCMSLLGCHHVCPKALPCRRRLRSTAGRRWPKA
jgi:fumarate reductase iron-sulfur subunit